MVVLIAVLDLGNDLDLWPWIWLGLAVLFAVIEFTILAGSFVLLPFSISAFIASLLGFYDVAIEIQWFVFVFGGAAIWVLMYKRVMMFAGDNEIAPNVGAERVVGLTGIVTTAIDPSDTDRRGRVTVEGEVWGAITDGTDPIPEGTNVRVTAMVGTRVHVEPIGSSAESSEAP